jgi:hypothetical protein
MIHPDEVIQDVNLKMIHVGSHQQYYFYQNYFQQDSSIEEVIYDVGLNEVFMIL